MSAIAHALTYPLHLLGQLAEALVVQVIVSGCVGLWRGWAGRKGRKEEMAWKE